MGRYIRFDWAAKHILRDKADFVVFEGLIYYDLKSTSWTT